MPLTFGLGKADKIDKIPHTNGPAVTRTGDQSWKMSRGSGLPVTKGKGMERF